MNGNSKNQARSIGKLRWVLVYILGGLLWIATESPVFFIVFMSIALEMKKKDEMRTSEF